MIELIGALGGVLFCAVSVAYAASVWIKKERAEKEIRLRAVRAAEEAIRRVQESRPKITEILELKSPSNVHELAVK